MSWNPKYAMLIGLSTIITYIFGILCDKFTKASSRKISLIFSLASNLSILILFKYSTFLINNLNVILSKLKIEPALHSFDLLLPVGISFYTFQALSYTIDVYNGKIRAERNILKYALYVSFFPQLVAGPIERSGNLLPQIQNIASIKLWNIERIKHGFLLMLWGYFQKLVIADRAAILVKNVFQNYQNYGFLEISLAAICFAFQIYGDFGGYTNIARGAAQIMGFHLMDNFKQPYLASSIKDFWKRWHISLTSWFTDYLYIPLGGNRKGLLRKYFNIIIVFTVSGLWHGAAWNYIIWGFLHALFQIAEDIYVRVSSRFINKTQHARSFSTRFRKSILCFAFVDFAWIFFAADSLKHALSIIKQMFTAISRNPSSVGFSHENFIIFFISILVLFIVDILHEKNISIMHHINCQEFWFRWLIYIGALWTVLLFGIYGIEYDTSTFIYFQF